MKIAQLKSEGYECTDEGVCTKITKKETSTNDELLELKTVEGEVVNQENAP